jgi:putative CocE/NonD family hydrolase
MSAEQRPQTLYGLLVPMRDGVQLALDVRLPRGEGPHPVVLIRTMYDKVEQRDAVADPARGIPYDGTFVEALLSAGYALAVQDVRGRFDSDGKWHPYIHERRDGFDTVEWIYEQAWCNGNIGMIGRSYVGYTQWMAAVDRPRGLKAIVPISPQTDLYHGYPLINGAFLLAMGELGIKGGRHSFQIRDFMKNVMVGAEPYFDTLPISKMYEAAGVTPPPWWNDMMSHPDRDDYWLQGAYHQDVAGVEVAALGVTGWYDLVVDGAIDNFKAVQSDASEPVRSQQELIVGPWAHWVNVRTDLNGVDYGADSLIDLHGYVISFFDRWLTGETGPPSHKPVRVFVMGANEWWEADTWPLPETDFRALYLRGDGQGGDFGSGGQLSFEAPNAEPADTYAYDPRDPVTSEWSMHAGPVDDRGIAVRDDVLTYATAPLEEPLDVVGPVSLVLHASSSAPDTDWHVRLVDIHDDGAVRFVCHGVLRARYRDSFEKPTLLEPGEVYPFEIRLTPTAMRFDRGHRIGVEIMSSWFPRFERNMNSGASNNHEASDPQIANQTVLHEAAFPSHLVLPVIPGSPYQAARFAPRTASPYRP